MAQYGITPNGFVIKDLNTIRVELRDRFQTVFGSQLNVQPDSVMGQIIDIQAAAISEAWELAEAVYNAFDRDSATGAALDNVAGFAPGITREPARPTRGSVTFTGDPGTLIPSKTIVGDPVTKYRFETDVPLTLDGSGQGNVTVTAIENGPLHVLSPGQVVDVITPVAGVDAVWNEESFVTGAFVEEDADLRLRILESLQIGGKSVDQAIKAEVLAIPGVTNAQVLSNRSLIEDEFGTPGKSFLTVLYPESGDVDFIKTIGQTIFMAQPAGIKAWGTSETVKITDREGYEQEVKFTWASEIDITLQVEIVSTQGNLPVGYQDLIKTLMFEYIDSLNPGENVRYLKMVKILVSEIPQIEELNITITANGVPRPVNTSQVIGFDQIAIISSKDDIGVV